MYGGLGRILCFRFKKPLKIFNVCITQVIFTLLNKMRPLAGQMAKYETHSHQKPQIDLKPKKKNYLSLSSFVQKKI